MMMILKQGAQYVGIVVATQLTGLLLNAVTAHIWTTYMQYPILC